MQNDDLENKRRELELNLANHYYMSDRSKYELIRKIMDVLQDAIEDDKNSASSGASLYCSWKRRLFSFGSSIRDL